MKESETIYEKIALANGVSVRDVYADIQEAIGIAAANQSTYVKENRKQILGSENLGTPEELVKLISEYISKQPLKRLVS